MPLKRKGKPSKRKRKHMFTIEGVDDLGHIHLYSDAENADPVDVTYGPFGSDVFTACLLVDGGVLIKVEIDLTKSGTTAEKVYNMTLLDDGGGRASLLEYTDGSNAAQTDIVIVGRAVTPVQWCALQDISAIDAVDGFDL